MNIEIKKPDFICRIEEWNESRKKTKSYSEEIASLEREDFIFTWALVGFFTIVGIVPLYLFNFIHIPLIIIIIFSNFLIINNHYTILRISWSSCERRKR